MYFLKKMLVFVMDILETIVFIGSIFIVVYLFIMQPNQVKGLSMFPTFNDQDYILTSKITYKFRAPQRGDVIVFKAPQQESEGEVEFIKRVIGLPGDSVVVQSGEVFVNGHQVSENYIAEKTNVWGDGFTQEGVPMVVPTNNLFVMGDNRTHSSDSRRFGFIDEQSIIGFVFYRYFPANKIGFISNPLKNQILSHLSYSWLASL